MKCALILPYFGHFDALFPLWLETCRWNGSVDWLVFTDDRRGFAYPNNVRVYYMDFDTLRQRIQSLYDFPISLDSPYRLCNFKPAYGEIFSEYLNGYEAWGFCDNDMLYGCLESFISPKPVSKYKIGSFGHLSIMPNTSECKTIYRYADAYKTAFSMNRPLFFDENAYVNILRSRDFVEFPLHIADFIPRIRQHRVLNEIGREWMNEAHCFVWTQGRLWRYYVDLGGCVQREEYAYIHFLKRPMKVSDNLDLTRPWVIVPNRIMNMDPKDITVEFLLCVSRPGIFWSYWKHSFKPKNFWERLANRCYWNRRDRRLMQEMNERIARYDKDGGNR